MKKVSTQILKKRLRQTTWLPIAIVVALLMGTVAFLLKQQFDEKLSNTAMALSEVMKSQQTFFSEDVFLNSDQGIRLRVSDLLEKWKEKYPSVQACIRIEYGSPQKDVNKVKNCSLGSVDADTIFTQHPFERTYVKVGDQTLASIDQAVIRPTTINDLFPPVLWLTMIIAVLGATFAHRILVDRVESRILNPLLEKITEDERNAAIAETTRMVAHDIRKPFQVLRLALNSLLESKNAFVRQAGRQIGSDIEGSVRKVNAMLQDILDISQDVKAVPKKASAAELIRSCLNDVIKFYPEVRVDIKLDLNHRQVLLVDPEKIARVFTNLFENAIQAIGRKSEPAGTLWITSEDAESGQIRFRIANDGPRIDEKDVNLLFSPFFTRRKGGTGLGLSISEKIVNSHGGDIRCSHSTSEQTSFSFTLPGSEVLDLLVEEGGENLNALDQLKDRVVLIFDDERSVHSSWQRYADNHPYITLCHFHRWEDFVQQNAFSLAQNAVAFVDIHYTNSRYDGIDIAKALKKLGVNSIYAITNDGETATQSGVFDRVFGKEVPLKTMILTSQQG